MRRRGTEAEDQRESGRAEEESWASEDEPSRRRAVSEATRERLGTRGTTGMRSVLTRMKMRNGTRGARRCEVSKEGGGEAAVAVEDSATAAAEPRSGEQRRLRDSDCHWSSLSSAAVWARCALLSPTSSHSSLLSSLPFALLHLC